MKKVSKKEHGIRGLVEVAELAEEQRRFEQRMTMIQTLIPLGMMFATHELQAELRTWVGKPYERGKALDPWGSNAGSICLGNQKVRVPPAPAGNL